MKLQIGTTPLMRDIREAETFRTPKNIFLKILIFVGVFGLMVLVQSIAMGAAEQLHLNEQMGNLATPITTLLTTGIGALTVLLFCRLVEGRKFRTMGFYKKGWWWKYLRGLVCGFASFSMVVGLSALMGGLHFEGYRGQFGVGLLLLFIGFLIQGMFEEVVCRGFMMTSTLRHYPIWVAVAVNSIIFTAVHAGSSGFSLLAALNLLLYAAMISFYVLRTNDLWGACAFHSIWNFVQGNFYGLSVSGNDAGDTVFAMSLTDNTLANGGEFGPEASLATTIVMAVWIFVLLFVPNPFAKRQDAAPAQAE